MPLDELLTVTASKEPIPGGGGIAAMTAASAAALVEMVANLTIGKKGYEEIEKLMISIRDKAQSLRQRYLDGIAEDAAAFDNVIRSVRLPKDTPDRTAIVQQAFKDAATSPFELGKDIFALLQLAEQAVRYGNAWVITDGAIAAMNARAPCARPSTASASTCGPLPTSLRGPDDRPDSRNRRKSRHRRTECRIRISSAVIKIE